MRFIGAAASALMGLVAQAAGAATEPPNLQFDNGYWFDGTDFERRPMYSSDGRLTLQRPDMVDQIVDLEGGYAIPPLCEAHNHNLGGDEPEDAIIARYLEAGIYYVGILSNLPRYTGTALRNFNRPDSVDVRFANGGITAPGAHPISLRERLLGYGAYPGFTRETLADHAYFSVGTSDDLDRIWPIALSFRPDFIKIFIMHSEDHDVSPEHTSYEGRRGLHPELVRSIVGRSHEHGLRVFAHVETAHDFRVATEAGVDVIAHIPGRREPDRIDPQDARRAAERGIAVITTAALVSRLEEDEPQRFEAVRAMQIENLRVLRDAGVRLALGSDLFDSDTVREADYLRETGVFSSTELLNMWTGNCAATIFPDRRIGRLENGYETSFIVLGSNPLDNWSALRDIRLRIKDGRVLNLAPQPEAE